MKLNFWQWIGIFIVLVALIVIVRREMGERGVAPDRAPSPTPEFSPQKAVEVPTAQSVPTTAAAAASPTTGPAAP